MCGIMAITGSQPVTERLMAGLKRLEYRGYDSAGLAVDNGSVIARRRAAGKLANLQALLESEPCEGHCGIAHTRWATHGAPTEANAHPHHYGRVFLVHNGIIENHAILRQALLEKGHVFESDTDTEIVAHALDAALADGLEPRNAFHKVLKSLEGAYAIVAMIEGVEGVIYCARLGSPVVIGHGDNTGEGVAENYVGSDMLALAPLTQNLTYLEEGDWAEISPRKVQIFDRDGNAVTRSKTFATARESTITKDGHQHFMLKEILEQPASTARSIMPLLDVKAGHIKHDPNFVTLFAEADRAIAIACGSANIATRTAQYWFEALAGLNLSCDIASEFRYRKAVLPRTGPAIFVSQSGETADTLQALKHCVRQHVSTIAVVNVAESSIDRAASARLYTNAGPEIGVASTKAFTAQMAVLLVMAMQAARARGLLDSTEEAKLVAALADLPEQIEVTLDVAEQVKPIAQLLARHPAAVFIGRGQFSPIAAEGALKLKELAYIHAGDYAAGELKHGPIALIEAGFPVIAIAPMDSVFSKTLSNLEEVKARGAQIILITDASGAQAARSIADRMIIIPQASVGVLAPILATIPLQFLAYYTALARGTDVDMPRNLAKSVTVE